LLVDAGDARADGLHGAGAVDKVLVRPVLRVVDALVALCASLRRRIATWHQRAKTY